MPKTSFFFICFRILIGYQKVPKMKSSNSYSSRSNPFSISELLNSDNSYTSVFPSFEEPKNYYSYIQKLINRTRNVEAEMKRNFDHGKLLLNEFFRLLETTEMVAFDIMYVDTLWGEVEFKDFYDFIAKCRNADFVFDRPTDKDIQQASEHIRYLHSIIQTCCKDFHNYDSRVRIEPPQHPNKIYKYLDELTQTIEDDIRKTEIKKHEPSIVPFDYGNDDISDNTTLPDNSKKFIDKLLDLVQPNRDSNQTIAPNRSLLGNIFHKMNTIRRLQNEIKEIKKDIMVPKYAGSLDIDPQYIQNSPFYRAVLGNAAFLRLSINNFLSEQPEIDNCEASIENSLISFSKLQHQCQETVKATEKLQEELKKGIFKKQKDLKDPNNDISQYYDLFLCDPKIEKIYKLIDEVTNLDKEFTELLEAEQSKQSSLSNNSAADKISGCIDIMPELRDTRRELFDLCRNCAEERKEESLMQKKLFTLVAEYLVHNEKQHNYDRIIQVFDTYKNFLDEIFKLFKKEEVDAWCRDVNTALNEIQNVLNEHDELIKKSNDDHSTIDDSSNQTNNENDDLEAEEGENDIKKNTVIDVDDEIRKYEQEIEQLERELADVNYEQIQMEEEVEKKKEELFDQIQMNDMYIIYQESNQHKTEQLKKFKESLICSICNERFCDAVIYNNKKTCNHAFCKQCIELDDDKKTGECPICGASYTNENILEFSLNPRKF